MNQMLELSVKDHKVTTTKMLQQAVKHSLETSEKNRKSQKINGSYQKNGNGKKWNRTGTYNTEI